MFTQFLDNHVFYYDNGRKLRGRYFYVVIFMAQGLASYIVATGHLPHWLECIWK